MNTGLKYDPDRKWIIEVTEQQLYDIISDVEDIHRFLAGQTELYNATCYVEPSEAMFELRDKMRDLQPLVTPHLPAGASYKWNGGDCPNEEQREKIARGYGIYRQLRHILTMFYGHQNVYSSPTLLCNESKPLPIATPVEEEWRDIPGYEGIYQVSNKGAIKAVARFVINRGVEHFRKEHILSTSICKGYVRVAFGLGGHTKSYFVHVLVAKAFIPNPKGYKEVNHKDENKLNNTVANLEWCDRTYNIHYGISIKERNKKVCKPIGQFTDDGVCIAKFESVYQASRETGIGDCSIRNSLKGRNVHGGGYIWKYIDKEDYYKTLAVCYPKEND